MFVFARFPPLDECICISDIRISRCNKITVLHLHTRTVATNCKFTMPFVFSQHWALNQYIFMLKLTTFACITKTRWLIAAKIMLYHVETPSPTFITKRFQRIIERNWNSTIGHIQFHIQFDENFCISIVQFGIRHFRNFCIQIICLTLNCLRVIE